MSFRFIFYSDTHLGFDFPLRSNTRRPHRGKDFFDNLHRIYNYAIEQKVSLLVHGGDVFYRSRVPKKLVNHVYMILHDYAAKGIKTIIVPGNHERSQLPVSLLTADENILIFDRPRTFLVQTNDKPVIFAGFPFEPENIRQKFNNLLTSTGYASMPDARSILCVHQAIDGAQVGPHNYTFRNRGDVMDINSIPDTLSLVLCGHIHRRQILYGKNNLPIIFAGSIERTSFAEMNEPKGFYDIYVPETTSPPQIRFIELPTRPMLNLHLADDLSDTILIDKIKKLIPNIPANAIIRVNGQNVTAIKVLKAHLPATVIIKNARNNFSLIHSNKPKEG